MTVAIIRPQMRYEDYTSARSRLFIAHARAMPVKSSFSDMDRKAGSECMMWLRDQLGPQAWGGYVDKDIKHPIKHGFPSPLPDTLVYFDESSLWFAKWAGAVWFKQKDHAAAFMLAWRGRLLRQ